MMFSARHGFWPCLCAIVVVQAFAGCSLRSRYAMDDPVYAEKYAEGAEKGDLVGKAKQAIDARHTGGLSGLYLSGGAQVAPNTGDPIFGAEVGAEYYPTNWLTARGSLGGYLGMDDGFGGLDAGIRIQTPSRLALFAGVGTFHGVSRSVEIADRDGIDNDDNGFIDEHNEKKSNFDGWLSSIYPEIGAHLWINGRCRLSAYGRYLVTTEGRDQDDWLIGGQLTMFQR